DHGGGIRIGRQLVDLVDDHLPAGAGISRLEVPDPDIGSRLKGSEVVAAAQSFEELSRFPCFRSETPSSEATHSGGILGVEATYVRLMPAQSEVSFEGIEI